MAAVASKSKKQRATLYRMATDQHLCPYGLKVRDLLERRGVAVDDHKLTSRAETDAFKAEHNVETTPQAFIGGQRSAAIPMCAGILVSPYAIPRPSPTGR